MLEARIAAYFTSAGYGVRCNAVLAGRSGGSHEIDVLAEKTDSLMTVKVMVECKAWDRPIEKDVISKVDYVLKDLGLNKGIIVSLNGWRSGALQAATELGIDLWGPAELRLQLGAPVVADLNVGSRTPQEAAGYPFFANRELAEQRIYSSGKALFGLRTVETVSWVRPVWLPAYRARVTVSRLVKQALPREKVVNSSLMTGYDGVTGHLIQLPATPPTSIDISSGALNPKLKPTQISSAIETQVKTYRKLRQAVAVQRAATQLAELGIPTPFHSCAVEGIDLVFLPIYLGLLESSGRSRLVAVSGVAGEIREAMGTRLTGQLSHVLHSLGDSPQR